MASTQFTANSNGEKGGKKFGFWALIIVITLAVLILIFNLSLIHISEPTRPY